jgi:hypothetical protein
VRIGRGNEGTGNDGTVQHDAGGESTGVPARRGTRSEEQAQHLVSLWDLIRSYDGDVAMGWRKD